MFNWFFCVYSILLQILFFSLLVIALLFFWIERVGKNGYVIKISIGYVILIYIRVFVVVVIVLCFFINFF